MARQLRDATQGDSIVAETPTLPVEQKPEERSHFLSGRELMDESRRTFEQIVRSLMRLPAEDIFMPQLYEWAGDIPVGTIIPTYTVEHYRRYDGPIRRWITKRRRRRSRS